jgi:secreted Zn-dependent insulinase-like peptidase
MHFWDSKHAGDQEKQGSDEEMGEDEQEEGEEGTEEKDNEGDGENNNCISIYFQSDRPNDLKEVVLLDLIEAIMEDEMFDVLRTKQ